MTVLAKQPSEDLISMIKVAGDSLLSFGELWGSIKKKGHSEGFSEKELQEMLRPYLKEKLDSKKVWYLFHAEEQKDRSKQQYQNRTNISTNVGKKEPEQTPTIEELPPNAPTKTSEQFYEELEADKIEQEYKRETAQASSFDLSQIHLTDPKGLVEKAVLTDDNVFQYLRDRAKETGNIIIIDRVGAGALVQALAQYKRSFKVCELFLRVIE